MLRGLQILGQAKNALIQHHEIISNNLANLGTAGFKKDAVAFHEVLDQKTGSGLKMVMNTDSNPGAFEPTQNPLDLAIQGKGYFALQTPNGIRYTRNGSFQLNEKGVLCSRQGHPVLSEKGQIALNPELEGTLSIGLDGTISQGGIELGKVLLNDFKGNVQLNKVGENLFELVSGQTTPAASQIYQGTLETSTVNSVEEMVEMLDTLRLFEAAQTASQMQDGAFAKAIRELV